jgi:tRNA-binding EMAP/Myf-like protein
MPPASISAVIIGIAGAITGKVEKVRPHPRGEFIWLADVDLGDGNGLVQIVFGGKHKLQGGELVPVAPPGSQVVVQYSDDSYGIKKMRARRYRGERSHGMLCSLDELGWIRGGPNEVAVLCDLTPGQSLDYFPPNRWPEVVVGWEHAKQMEMEAAAKRRAGIPLASPAASSILWRLDLVLEHC